MTEAELAYREEARDRVAEGFRRGVPVGICVTLAIAVLAQCWLPGATFAIPAGVIGAGLLLAGRAVFRISAVVRRPLVVIVPIGLYNAVVVGYAAAGTGGFGSVTGVLVLHVLIFGFIVVSMSLQDFVIAAIPTITAASVVIAIASPDPGSPSWFVTIIVTGAGVIAAATALRDRAERRTFQLARELVETNRKLAESQGTLAQLNGELEAQVRAQVGEILDRTADLEALNVQLRAQVRQRSRELDAALARLAHTDDTTLPAGAIVGDRARIVALLGTGGAGDVYLADDLLTGRRVAVKILARRHHTDIADLRRFVAEANALATIAHPVINQIFHVDCDADGRMFQLMEYVRGETLEQRQRQDPLGVDDALRTIGHVASALSAAHAKEIIHRDVKPANIMLTDAPPGVRLLDFGAAKLAAPLAADGDTTTGTILGTPRYLAPEVLAGAVPTPAADVYAIGRILTELVPTPPADIVDVIARAIDPDPARRPTSGAIAQRLLACTACTPALTRAWPGAGKG